MQHASNFWLFLCVINFVITHTEFSSISFYESLIDRMHVRQIDTRKRKKSKEIDKICLRAKMNEMRQRSRAWRLEKKKKKLYNNEKLSCILRV